MKPIVTFQKDGQSKTGYVDHYFLNERTPLQCVVIVKGEQPLLMFAYELNVIGRTNESNQ